MNSTKSVAVVTIVLGVAAIVLPYFFGALAVRLLGAVMLASGVVSLLYVNAARREGEAPAEPESAPTPGKLRL